MSRAHKYIFTLFTLKPESMRAIAQGVTYVSIMSVKITLPTGAIRLPRVMGDNFIFFS